MQVQQTVARHTMRLSGFSQLKLEFIVDLSECWQMKFLKRVTLLYVIILLIFLLHIKFEIFILLFFMMNIVE